MCDLAGPGDQYYLRSGQRGGAERGEEPLAEEDDGEDGEDGGGGEAEAGLHETIWS